MTQAYVLSFTKDVSVDFPAPDQVVIQTLDRRSTLKGLTPGLVRAITILSSQGASEDELSRQVAETDGESALARFYYYLSIFSKRCMIRYGISCNGKPMATLSPISAHFQFNPGSLDPESKYTLSRFSYLHRENEDPVLESPLSHGKITLHGWMGAAIAAELAGAKTLGSLCDLLKEIPRDAIELFLGMLLAAGFLIEAKPEDPYHGETRTLAQWDFHDLLFHARSRLGRHANRFGGTYRFIGKIDPLPAVKPASSGQTLDLYKPDMEKLEQEDYPFTLVLEHRKSIREYAERPITDRQLGEFLYRTARVKELIKHDVQDVSRRSYPGGGAIYELEIYVNVNACESISPGFYHYCPKNHGLEPLCGPTEATAALFKDAVRSTGLELTPQVLFTIASRFQRLSWKYESMAYNTMLKNVGVLYQTMYLVATAMDLAPCAIGGGNSDLFAEAAALDYYAETSVGEFLLGSKRM
ncbi:MAG: SagB/ThcOx family dehydrogenase [Desulfobacteraceae bacterium]|nr:MAG: SagB/ThcOx family dehydrogenase [Desulfobacteraceae bacterium]